MPTGYRLTDLPKMDPGVKKKWLAALRSGKYKQGRSRLKTGMTNDPQYCCLGVLCDISGLGHWTTTNSYQVKEGDHEGATLPDDVAEWAGISNTIDDVTLDAQMHLIARNDGGQVEGGDGGRYYKPIGFKGIAAFVEKYL